MSAKFVSSTFYKTIQKGAKTLAVDYVDKTTAWTRPPGLLSDRVKDEFAELVEENANSFREETTTVAMKESAHQSDEDKRVHYTAYELSKDNVVVATRHLVKDK